MYASAKIMAITNKSDRKIDRIEPADEKPDVVSGKSSDTRVCAYIGTLVKSAHSEEAPANIDFNGQCLFEFFNSFDLTNNIR